MTSFTGRCDWCGGVPPSLQWMYPSRSSRGQERSDRSRARHRPPRQGEPRSSSTDRVRGGTRPSTLSRDGRRQRH